MDPRLPEDGDVRKPKKNAKKSRDTATLIFVFFTILWTNCFFTEAYILQDIDW